MLALEKLEENEQLLHEEIIPIPINTYWDNFYADDCPFNLKEFIEEHKGDIEMNL